MNTVKTAVYLALLTAILMVIGQLVAGETGLLVMFIISMAMNLFGYWNSDKVVLSMYDAKQISESDNPNLYHMVERLTARAHMPMPKVYIINSNVPNAFATGRNPNHAAVAVTTGIMDLLTDDEIEGVLGHELTHVRHRDTLISTIAASVAGVISMVANILQFATIFGGRDDKDNANPIVLIGTIILAPLAAALIQMAISRSREYLADEGGAEMCGNPLALASALAKIDYYSKYGALPNVSEKQAEATAHMFIINPIGNLKSLGANLFSTHPSTEKRIAKLKEMAAQRR